jgi:hypothetical protein
MPVHVDELTTDVSVEPGAGSTPSTAQTQAPSAWQESDAFRAMRERLARVAERTKADAYGD